MLICGKYFFLSVSSFLFFFKSTTVYGFIEPMTAGFAAGAFVMGFFADKLPFFRDCPQTFEIKGGVS